MRSGPSRALAASAAGQLKALGRTVTNVSDSDTDVERAVLLVDGSGEANATAATIVREAQGTDAVETTTRHADEDLGG